MPPAHAGPLLTLTFTLTPTASPDQRDLSVRRRSRENSDLCNPDKKTKQWLAAKCTGTSHPAGESGMFDSSVVPHHPPQSSGSSRAPRQSP